MGENSIKYLNQRKRINAQSNDNELKSKLIQLDKHHAENLLKLQCDLTLALSSITDLDKAFDKILESTFKLVEIDCGGFYLIDEKTDEINLVYHKGLPQNFIKSSSHYSAKSAQAKLIKKGKPIYGHFSKLALSKDKIIFNEKLKAIAILPLIFEKKTIGALNLASHSHDEIPPDTKKTLEIIATQVSGLITRLKIEKELLLNQSNLHNLFNTLGDFLFILDSEGFIIDYNPIVKNRLGFTENELSEMHVLDFHPENRKEEVKKIIKNIMEGKSKTCQIPLQTKDGKLIPVETKVNKGVWGSKAVLFGISRDITERKQSQDSLIEEHSFNASIIKNAAEGICVCHAVEEFPFVQFTVWNNQMEKITGHTLEQINKKGWYQSLYPDPEIQKKAIDRMSRMRIGDDIRSEGWEIVCANGDKKHIVISTSMLQTTDNQIHILGLMHDVTERKVAEEQLKLMSNNLEKLVDERTKELEKTNKRLKKEISERKTIEQTLRESEEKYRRLVEISPDAITLTDMNGIVKMINPSALKMYGYSAEEEMVGLNSINLVAPEHKPKVVEMFTNSIETGIYSKFSELTNVRKDGSKFPVEIHASLVTDKDNNPIATINTVRDITIRKRMEEELHKSEKLESVGVLAGGIAHDFNNLLTGIIGNISLAKMYKDSEKDMFNKLVEAEKASFRAKDLTQKLLTFSKGGSPVKSILKINKLLKETANFALSGSNVKGKYEISDNICTIEADEGQIGQVISNIVINAKQVMPKGGTIHISCQNIFIPDANKLPLKKGNYIKISIADTGTGIGKEHIPYIFDPYFTTKQSGNGLGLATAYSIVKKHNGYITVDSILGKGTEFIVYLPSLESKSNLETSRPEKIKKQEKRILVMDDEQMILDVTSNLLSSLGYDVECAQNGEDAIKLYTKAFKENKAFDLVIMDLTIPAGMGGQETIKKLKKINQDVLAIVSSGYSNDPVLANFEKFGFKGVITKPFKFEEFKDVVQNVLAVLKTNLPN